MKKKEKFPLSKSIHKEMAEIKKEITTKSLIKINIILGIIVRKRNTISININIMRAVEGIEEVPILVVEVTIVMIVDLDQEAEIEDAKMIIGQKVEEITMRRIEVKKMKENTVIRIINHISINISIPRKIRREETLVGVEV